MNPSVLSCKWWFFPFLFVLHPSCASQALLGYTLFLFQDPLQMPLGSRSLPSLGTDHCEPPQAFAGTQQLLHHFKASLTRAGTEFFLVFLHVGAGIQGLAPVDTPPTTSQHSQLLLFSQECDTGRKKSD